MRNMPSRKPGWLAKKTNIFPVTYEYATCRDATTNLLVRRVPQGMPGRVQFSCLYHNSPIFHERAFHIEVGQITPPAQLAAMTGNERGSRSCINHIIGLSESLAWL